MCMAQQKVSMHEGKRRSAAAVARRTFPQRLALAITALHLLILAFLVLIFLAFIARSTALLHHE